MTVDSGTFHVNSNSNRVGIGVPTPNFTLDIEGDINASGYRINGQDIESILSWKKKSNGNLYYNEGLVGIGTSLPQYAVDVSGNVNASAYLMDGIPLENRIKGLLAWQPGKNVNDIYFNDGTRTSKVGIGTTEPKETLDVVGGIRIGKSIQSSPKEGTIEFDGSDFYGYTATEKRSLTGIQSVGAVETGQLTFWSSKTSLSGSPYLYWNNEHNRLGLGTNSPQARLDIRALETDDPMAGLLSITGANNKNLFYVSSRNVGIGTSTPEYTLDIKGVINADDFTIGGQPLQTQLLSGTYWSLENYERVFYDLGNVGIGTTQPHSLLELSSATGNPILTFDVGNTDLFSMGINADNPDAFIISEGGDLETPVFTFKGDRIGVGLASPNANLHVSGNTGVLISGKLDSGEELPASGPGTRMLFYPSKAAFRAGTVEQDEWDSANLGKYSIGLGYSSIASGEGASVIGGYKNIASGQYATVAGGYQN